MDVDQPKVEAFASEIHHREYARSHFEIDDRWSPYYGDLSFDAVKFPDPIAMVQRLHALGFEVTLWVTPFAEPDSAAYADGRAHGHWLRTADGSGQPAAVTWWQGEGVALNVSDDAALAWMETRLRALMASTGVDGFKFDAGEAQFVPPGLMRDPNAYCHRWAQFAARFGGAGEVRCACGSQHVGVWTREFDKDSRWSAHNGLRALVTSALQLSVLGYPFVLPDMVGGNAYSDEMLGGAEQTAASSDAEGRFDAAETRAEGDSTAGGAPPPPAALSSLFYGALPPRELYVRWCAANALLPAVQFSIAPWQYDEAATAACRKVLERREERLPLLESLAQRAISHGEPIVRPLWWHDPRDATCQWVDDQFLLGNATLVAPVLDPGEDSRSVYLPRGTWRDGAGKTYVGPAWMVDYRVPLDELAVFDLVA